MKTTQYTWETQSRGHFSPIGAVRPNNVELQLDNKGEPGGM